MMRPTIVLVCAATLGFVACSDRPLDTASEDPEATTTAADTGDATSQSPPTTDAPTTDTPAADSTPDPTTGGDPGDTVDTVDTGDTGSTGGAPGPAATPCGACPATWESKFPIEIKPGDDLTKFDCLSVIHGPLAVSGDLTADELAFLANVTRVEGMLQLTGNAVLTDLSPFACLREVDYELGLYDLPALTDLSGLANLEALTGVFALWGTGAVALPALAPGFHGINGLWLIDNPALADVGAVAGWIPGAGTNQLTVTGNPNLVSLDGLQPLVAIANGVEIGDAPITSLVGLETLPTTPNLWLHNLPALPSLAGLEGITGGDFGLQRLPLVPDLTPLANLHTVGSLRLEGMPLVTSLAPLANLHTVEWRLDIGGCTDGMDGLTDLTGLDALTAVEWLQIGNNDNLASLAGLAGVTAAKYVKIAANPLLPPAAFDAFVAQIDPPPSVCFECELCGQVEDD